jgi:putative two-component system response regulator
MINNNYKDSKILIVDDKVANIQLLKGILEEDDILNFKSITDSRNTLVTFLEFKPDLVLLDLHMPHMDGFEVLKRLRDCIPPYEFLPILVLTADSTSDVKRRALLDGAADFLAKPIDPVEVTLRIRNLIHTRLLHKQLENQNQILEQAVLDRTQQLTESRIEILKRLAIAAEYRDDNIGEHAHRVGELAAQIAAGLGMNNKEVDNIRLVAPLHDIGKIGIPDSILLKPGKLTPEEWEVMKTHTTIGANILSGSSSPLLQMAEEIAQTHHERWDGSGYFGMRGEEIPITGRIVTIVDVFDALLHDRPYRKAWSIEEGLSEIEKQRGKQFDTQVVEAFLEVIRSNKIYK